MKSLMFMLLFCCSTVFAGDMKYNGIAHSAKPYQYSSTTTARRNVFGGSHYYRGSDYIGTSRPNVFGGFNYYENKGKMIYRSVPYRDGYRYYSFGR